MTSRHENIANSLQTVTEEIIMHLLRRLHATKSPNVCLTGGVAMNSVANGKVTRKTPFEQVYVPAGAADNGTSFGAALYVWCRTLGKPRRFVQDHAYWGCESSADECEAAIREACLPFETFDQDTLLERTTDLLQHGKVVGWFQGRMEFGARALGNRTLLADPAGPTCGKSSISGSSSVRSSGRSRQASWKSTLASGLKWTNLRLIWRRFFPFARKSAQEFPR